MALINSLTSGVSALKSFARGLDVIGNNIANVNTTGFKRSRVDYEDTFNNVLQGSTPSTANRSNRASMQVGTGVAVGAISTNFTPGAPSQTGVSTDMAIDGDGFFQVRDPFDNTLYATRMGNFREDDLSNLVTQGGQHVRGLNNGYRAYDASLNANNELVLTPVDSAPSVFGDVNLSYSRPTVGSGVNVPPGGLSYVDPDSGATVTLTDDQINAAVPFQTGWSVAENGALNVTLSDGNSFSMGQILLMDFRDPQALMAQGSGLYTGFVEAGLVGGTELSAAGNTPGLYGLGGVKQSYLELSNVDLSEEFANMITAQRAFQAGSRIITVSDTILNEVVNLKR